jgi:hypothetical protein
VVVMVVVVVVVMVACGGGGVWWWWWWWWWWLCLHWLLEFATSENDLTFLTNVRSPLTSVMALVERLNGSVNDGCG